MNIVYIKALTGDVLVLELEEPPCRSSIIHTLHQMDPDTYPFDRTDIVSLMEPNWYSSVVYPVISIKILHVRAHPDRQAWTCTFQHSQNGLSSFERDVSPTPPTERDAEMMREGYTMPLTIEVLGFQNDTDTTPHYVLNHTFSGTAHSRNQIITGCGDGEHYYTALDDHLNHCRHGWDGEQCLRLTEEAKASITRLVEIHRHRTSP